jgi:uncharacterized protein (TIGR02285 family)
MKAAWIACQLLLAAPAVLAEAPPTLVITWISGGPQHADDGASGPREIREPMVDYLQARWPGSTHRIIQANAARAWHMIELGEPVCILAAMHSPDRDRLAYFSDTTMGPPPQLILRRDKLSRLPRSETGEIDLVRLLDDASLRGVLVRSRSYGGPVDAMIKAAGPDSRALHYGTSDFGSSILTMIANDHADYTVGYPVATPPEVEQTVTSEAISGASAPVLGGLACPRTPWGRAVVARIEQILGTQSAAAWLRQDAEKFLDTPELRRRYAPAYDAFYRKRAAPMAIR